MTKRTLRKKYSNRGFLNNIFNVIMPRTITLKIDVQVFKRSNLLTVMAIHRNRRIYWLDDFTGYCDCLQVINKLTTDLTSNESLLSMSTGIAELSAVILMLVKSTYSLIKALISSTISLINDMNIKGMEL